MTVDAQGYLAPIEEMSRQAGEILLKHFRRLSSIDKKGAVDLVTVADRETEDFLTTEILRRYPDHAILGEENGRHGNENSEFLWVLDPLDGTTNYAHGLRIFCVSIGLLHNGEIIAGAVHAPSLDEMFLAAKGAGATRNGERLAVSQAKKMEEALLVTGFPYQREGYLEMLEGMLGQCLAVSRGVLRLGSAALDLAYVAAGNLDGFYEFGLKPWDMAAGVLLVREAGGRVTGLIPNEEFDLFRPRVVASNGPIHNQLQQTILRGGAGRFPK